MQSSLLAIIAAAGNADPISGGLASSTHFVGRSNILVSGGVLTGYHDEVAGSGDGDLLGVMGQVPASVANGMGVYASNATNKHLGLNSKLFTGTGTHLAVAFKQNSVRTSSIMIGHLLNTNDYIGIWDSASTSTALQGGQLSSTKMRWLNTGNEYVTGVDTRQGVYNGEISGTTTGDILVVAFQDFSTGSRATEDVGVNFFGGYNNSFWRFDADVVGVARFTNWSDADTVMQAIVDDTGATSPTDDTEWTLVESAGVRLTATYNYVNTLLEGDLVVVVRASDLGSLNNDTPPIADGWADFFTLDSGASPSLHGRYKIMGATPDTSVTINASNQSDAVIAVFRHPNGCGGIEVNGGTRIAGGHSQHNKNIVTTRDRCLIVAAWGLDDDNGTATTDWPSLHQIGQQFQWTGPSSQNATPAVTAMEQRLAGSVYTGSMKWSSSDSSRASVGAFYPNPA